MTATRNTRQVRRLMNAFFRAVGKPITPLEDMTIHLQAALDCAKDTSKTEAARVKELKLRIQLMPVI
jgi:hypothetical protein